MAAAEADFQTLVDQVNEAGDLLITALNAGIAKLPERTWWDSVKRTFTSVVVGAVEAVVDLAKLLWKLGGGEAWMDFGRILMGDMTWDEYVIKHYEIPAETIVGMAKALWNDPVGFMKSVGKALLDCCLLYTSTITVANGTQRVAYDWLKEALPGDAPASSTTH